MYTLTVIRSIFLLLYRTFELYCIFFIIISGKIIFLLAIYLPDRIVNNLLVKVFILFYLMMYAFLQFIVLYLWNCCESIFQLPTFNVGSISPLFFILHIEMVKFNNKIGSIINNHVNFVRNWVYYKIINDISLQYIYENNSLKLKFISPKILNHFFIYMDKFIE